MEKNIHVTFHKDVNQWAVVTQGSRKAAGLFETKEEALKRGIEMAKAQRSELFIHRKDGIIEDRDSYGHDPFPPRDNVH